MYALEIHCCPARPPPTSRSIAGSATLTTVASSPATNDPRMAARRERRLRSMAPPGRYSPAPTANGTGAEDGMTDIKTVGVVGAGTMGHAIAQLTAQALYDVVIRETDDVALQRGLSR